MLDLIRKNAGSWVIRFILGAIVVVFIFWGVGSYRSQRMQVVAKVNGEAILIPQFQRAYAQTLDRYSKIFGRSLTPAMIKKMQLKKMVLEGLIRQVLIRQEARRLGVRVTDKELQDTILSFPAFQRQGVFSKRLYRLVLREKHMTPPEFEQELRDQLLNSKVDLLLTSSIAVPDVEAKDYYLYKNQQIRVSYAAIPSSSCQGQVKVTQDGLNKWFQAHKERYRTPPKIAISYILVARKEVEKGMKIDPEEVKEYYAAHKAEFHVPEQRRARHILVKVDPTAGPKEVEAARKRAEGLLKEIKGGRPFEEVAKAASDDTATKAKGGDLGFFSRGTMVKPFDQAVFSMKKGEIRGPVRTRFGWHIIQVTAIKPAHDRPLKEVRAEIAKRLLNQKVTGRLWEQANKIYDGVIDAGSMEAYAKRAGITLATTPLFSKADPPDLFAGAKPEALAGLFSLGKGELSSLIELPKGILIAQVKEKQPSHIPPLKEVEKRVKADFVAERARELCRAKAQRLLAKARKVGLAKAASAMGLKVETSPFFKRISGLGAPALPTAVVDAARLLRRGRPFPDTPIEAGGKWFVVAFSGSKDADLTGFPKEKEAIVKELLDQKRNMVLQEWVKELRERAQVEQITRL